MRYHGLMVSGENRVLLVDPPLRAHNFTVLGMATLKAILVRAGCPTDTLSGTHLFPRTVGDELREGLRTHFAQFYFTPHLFPSVSREDCHTAIRDSLLEQFSLQGVWIAREEVSLKEFGMDEAWLRDSVMGEIEAARVCIERCVARARLPAYDVVGFSCTFETQIPGAIAIASRLKAERPDVVILFGGAACFGPVADELVRSFAVIDAVCHAEGDEIIAPLVSAFRAPAAERAARLAAVPGIVWRDAGGPRRNGAPPLLEDLDRLPIPDYDDFMAQLADSEYADVAPHLYFETSRGCWWGEKHLCSFCGLNAEGIAYRKKSADRFYDEVRTLYERYPTAERLCATDNILGMDYLRTVMPRLAEWRRTLQRPLRMFFEIKANLRREQVRVMHEAGVDHVQPGIESFHDGILGLMMKGSTGLGQVQTIKWLAEQHIGAAYHLIVLNPQETAQHYRDMEALVPFIEHLPPPKIASMELQRFSPYHTDPASHGISNVRPRPYYAWAYPVPGIDVAQLAYRFDYDHDMFQDHELTEARRSFVKRALAWGRSWRPEMLYAVEREDSLVIVDERGMFVRQGRLTGLARSIFRYLDQVRTREQLRTQFATVSPELIEGLLATWVRRRWVCRDGQRYLSVIPYKESKGKAVRTVPAARAQPRPREIVAAHG